MGSPSTGRIHRAGWGRSAVMDENVSPSAVLTLYTLDGTGDLLALRRAFRHRDAGGAWLPALHAHQEPDEDPVDTARRIALSSLGLRLHGVRVVEQAATRATPWCPSSTEEVGPVLVASTGRRVVTPDPTLFDDADWVRGAAVMPPVPTPGLAALWRTASADVRAGGG